jgi:hypothetical protein
VRNGLAAPGQIGVFTFDPHSGSRKSHPNFIKFPSLQMLEFIYVHFQNYTLGLSP